MKSLSYLAIGLTLSIAPPAAAQAREALSLDATVGVSGASGGKGLYTSSASIAGEVTLGVRPHSERVFAALGAISFGRRARFEGNGDSRCVVPPPGSGNSECIPPFPNPTHIGILGGVEVRQDAGSLRALAGPAFYTGNGPSGYGAQMQLDGATGFSHLAFVAAVRGSWIVRVTGETLLFRSLEFGLRVQ